MRATIAEMIDKVAIKGFCQSCGSMGRLSAVVAVKHTITRRWTRTVILNIQAPAVDTFRLGQLPDPA